jgi:hypothetical protein
MHFSPIFVVSLTLSLSAIEKSRLTCGGSLFQNGHFRQI